MQNNNTNNDFTVNYNSFLKCIDELAVICTNKSLSNETHRIISQMKQKNNSSENKVNDSSVKNLVSVLKNVCPENFSDVIGIFNVELDPKYLKICDLIFTCINANIVTKDSIETNAEKYHMVNDYLESDDITYTYFNSNIPQESRVVTNKNDKKESKNTITLKIKNEDLNEDLLSLNMFVKLPTSDSLLDIRIVVKNDSYNTTRNNVELFGTYFNNPEKKKLYNTDLNNSQLEERNKLYNIVHLRDCCLDSFNGQEPFEYITKVNNAIKSCNILCQTTKKDKENKENNYHKKNKENNTCCDEDHNTNTKIESNMSEFLNLIKSDNFSSLCENSECTDSGHYIQKFAKYCFHTKYLIIVHTAQFHPQVCLFLALILVRCNNRLCREFLNTIPNIFKQTIMSSGCITGYDESKTDANVSDKESLSEKIIFWKSHMEKYGLNVKKLINKCNDLVKNEDDKSGSIFGGENGEKERTRKMLNYLEQIGSGFFLLNIHEKLINLINYAKAIYGNPKIESFEDIIKSVTKEIKKNGCAENILESDQFKNYMTDLNNFKKHVMKHLINMSEGQLTVKKEIYSYIIDFVTNPKPLTSRKILCLVGPPGVGKTFISLAIARILFFNPNENPSDDEVKQLVYILSIPGITDENSLLGSNSVYVGAKPGLLTRELLFNSKLCRKLIIFDEIDKKSNYIEQLIPVLDYTQNNKITDNYFDIELDMRSSILIATANDTSNIHPILKDRLHIIKVSGYSTNTKAKMVQSHIMPNLLKERSLDRDMFHIPTQVIEHVILKNTCEAGVRKLKEIILSIITTAKLALNYDINYDFSKNLSDDRGFFISDEEAFTGIFKSSNKSEIESYKKYYGDGNNNTEEFYYTLKNRYNKYHKALLDNDENPKIIITLNDINIILNKQEHKTDHINDIKKWESGKIIGLYATTAGYGGILPIAIKLNKSLCGKETLVTLGAKDTMKDSAKISTMLVSDYIIDMYNDVLEDKEFETYFGINKHKFKKHLEIVMTQSAPHIILDSSIQKDGPSAGGAFMIGFLSRILNHTLSKKVGLTGEISSNLTITAIGGLNMKMNGAMQGGCRSAVIPHENIKDMLNEIAYENSVDVKNTYGKRLAFIYYSEIEKSHILFVRSSPNNYNADTNKNIKLGAFDINVPFGKYEYLNVEFSNDSYEFNEINVPALYKYKLSGIKNNIIDPQFGLNIKLFDDDDITLSDIMKSHFLILGLENINEIYYYMVMSKYVFDNDQKVIEVKTIVDIANVDRVELDGIAKSTDSNKEKQITIETNQELCINNI